MHKNVRIFQATIDTVNVNMRKFEIAKPPTEIGQYFDTLAAQVVAQPRACGELLLSKSLDEWYRHIDE